MPDDPLHEKVREIDRRSQQNFDTLFVSTPETPSMVDTLRTMRSDVQRTNEGLKTVDTKVTNITTILDDKTGQRMRFWGQVITALMSAAAALGVAWLAMRGG